jgi:branched-chain amino acid transport system ATP-binding protein
MLLEVDSVDTHYGDLQALFGVDLHVDQGECVAIIGANGAGKSTLLSTIVGLKQPTAGQVRFDGRQVSALHADARTKLGISLVPEGRHVFPSLSVEENLRLGAWAGRKGEWSVARVYELFPMLEGRAGNRGWALSGGEQQALAIGRALMANPRLLLLDELSLGLAPVVVKQLYASLAEIKQTGTTLILVEQDIAQALAFADRVYCLLEGHIALAGKTNEFTRDQIVEAYFGIPA